MAAATNFGCIFYMVVCISSGKQAAADKPNIIFLGSKTLYDKFGDEVSVLRAGGYVLWQCQVSGVLCGENEKMELISPDNKIEAKICQKGSFQVDFRIDLSENTKLGNYTCRYNGHTNILKIDYILCDDQGDICKNGPVCPPGKNSFCVLSKKNKPTCSAVPSEDMCLLVIEYLCPARAPTLCHAFVSDKNYSYAYVQRSEGGCNKVEAMPRLTFVNKTLLFAEPVLIDPKHKEFRIVYTEVGVYHEGDLRCTFKDDAGNMIGRWNHTSRISFSATIKLNNEMFSMGSRVYKIRCTVKNKNNPDDAAIMTNVVVTLGGELRMVGPDDKNTLECRLEPAPSQSITVDYWWIQKTNGTKPIRHNGSTTIVTQTDYYKCHAIIRYRSCSPFRQWEIARNTSFQKFNATSGTCEPFIAIAGGSPRSILLIILLGYLMSKFQI